MIRKNRSGATNTEAVIGCFQVLPTPKAMQNTIQTHCIGAVCLFILTDSLRKGKRNMRSKEKSYTNPAHQAKGVIYTRFSSHSQRDVSIDQQVQACRRFADRQDIEILDIYEDRAMTGTNDKRPGFQKMLRDAERSNWDYVIVYTLDRFARNRYDSAIHKRALRNCGVKVLSAMENISDDPTGILMESILEGYAEYYSQELSRKIRRGMDDNAAKCLCNGQIPFGYVRGSDGRFAVDEREAAIVQDIYRKVRDGERIVNIITELNTRGILTKRGHPWTHSSFNTLLSNERYTGVYIYKDIRIPGGMPQIISPHLFDAVQVTIHTKANPRSCTGLTRPEQSPLPQRRRRENGIYYLTGKLFCGHCKSPMVGISGRSKCGPMYYYYTCKGKRAGDDCKKRNVNREQIERMIAKSLKENMLTDKAICVLADAAIDYQSRNSTDLETAALQERLSEIQRAVKNLVAAVEAGIFSQATQSRLAELEAEQQDITAKLAIAQEEAGERLTREEIIAALQLFQSGDVDDKVYQEALIDTFLVAAYVYDNEIKIVFNLGDKKKETTLPFDIEDIDFSESDPSTKKCRLHQ